MFSAWGWGPTVSQEWVQTALEADSEGPLASPRTRALPCSCVQRPKPPGRRGKVLHGRLIPRTHLPVQFLAGLLLFPPGPNPRTGFIDLSRSAAPEVASVSSSVRPGKWSFPALRCPVPLSCRGTSPADGTGVAAGRNCHFA